MSVYTPQNMILVSGIIAWILLVVVLVFKKKKFQCAPGLLWDGENCLPVAEFI